jgi:acyl carrier protein
MTNDEVKAKLTEILVTDFRIPAERITDEATFRGTLGMDSLDAVDLVYLLKKTFGLKADVHSFHELHSVKNVVEFIVKQKTAG